MAPSAALLPGNLDLVILKAISLGAVHGYRARLRRDVFPGVAGIAGGPLGHCRVHPRPATQPACHDCGCADEHACATGGRPMNDIVALINRLRRCAFGAGILLCALAGLGWAWHPHAFFVSYLFSYLFWVGLSLGCFIAALVHYLTGGRWGAAGLRIFEAGYMTLPLMAVLFVPLLFGLRELYPWAQPDTVAADKILQRNVAYENTSGFVLRTALFFLLWIVIAVRLRKWSLQQDVSADVAPTIKLRSLSGPATNCCRGAGLPSRGNRSPTR